ncbi:uncharacterized protein METZ01_LOCUS92723 [marine metagenome]|uniref:Aspartyl/asparaginy/proline hydroxylase domain-containing protein n=1 Tax=marine metagenome TaxID=408172 RepID=A0A381VHM9_9ZZZZ
MKLPSLYEFIENVSEIPTWSEIQEEIINTSWQEHLWPLSENKIDRGRYVFVPTKKTHRLFLEWIESQSQYSWPILTKVDAGSKIPAHAHPPESFDYLYNMSIIEPENCPFEIGGEEISYKSGDVYKLHIKNSHSVINNSDNDRVHVVIIPTIFARRNQNIWYRLMGVGV